MTRVGIIAAMPGELAPLVKGWERVPTAKHVWRWEKEDRGAKWIAACAGIGRDRATKAFAEAEKDGALSAVLTIGWAGALREGFSAGNEYQVRQIVNAQTGEQFEAVSGGERAGLVTSARIAGEAEKRRLAAAYPGAALVDMEGATVARLASMRRIPVFCFKAVSDGLEDRLPDMNPVRGRRRAVPGGKICGKRGVPAAILGRFEPVWEEQPEGGGGTWQVSE